MYARVGSNIVTKTELASQLQTLAKMEATRPAEWREGYLFALRQIAQLHNIDIATGPLAELQPWEGDPIDEEENDYDYPEADDYTPGGEDDTNV